MISIKRLKQNNEEFVPITTSEAVVVNGDGLWTDQPIITTLDKVLAKLFGNDYNINQQITNLNNKLSQFSPNLVAGKGIAIDIDAQGQTVISSTFSLYEIVTALPNPSEQCLNKIYIVKGPGDTDGNLSEYICVKNSNNDYYFENVGKVQINGEINLDNYVTVTQFAAAVASMITTTDVVYSNGDQVVIDYDIPTNLYDPV